MIIIYNIYMHIIASICIIYMHLYVEPSHQHYMPMQLIHFAPLMMDILIHHMSGRPDDKRCCAQVSGLVAAIILMLDVHSLQLPQTARS